jgi:hypothetical protein
LIKGENEMDRIFKVSRAAFAAFIVAVALIAGMLIDSTNALAGFGTSPAPQTGSSDLARSCSTGHHFGNVTIER